MTEETQEEEAPLFKRWNVWYVLVIGFLILLILFFYFLTKKFS
jgi:hypothetical protein